MKLKGNYSGDTSYNVGDIVIFDNNVYIKYQDGIAGSPKDTHCWNLLDQRLGDAVLLMMDAIVYPTTYNNYKPATIYIEYSASRN